MLLHDARRDGRVDDDGDLVPLEDQDRSRWDRDAIAEATEPARRRAPARAARAVPGAGRDRGVPRDRARRADATDWHEIAGLYRELAKMTSSPVVELNRAVAVAMADGPEAGLAIVDALDAVGRARGYHLLPATRADLLRRLGRHEEAAAAYRAAREAGAAAKPNAATSTGATRT